VTRVAEYLLILVSILTLLVRSVYAGTPSGCKLTVVEVKLKTLMGLPWQPKTILWMANAEVVCQLVFILPQNATKPNGLN